MDQYKILRLPLFNANLAEDVLNAAAEEGYHVTSANVVSNQDLLMVVAKELSPMLKEVVESRKAKRAKSEEE